MKQRNPKKETVKVGNASVTVYARRRIISGNEYVVYEVADFVSTPGKRRLRSFNDHQHALREAQRLARLLATGDAVAAAMSGKEAASFGRCLELLRRTGDAPELACSRYAAAFDIIGNGELLTAACRFYVERHPSTMPQVTLTEAAAEMIELRRQGGASEPYLADLRCRTRPFVEAFRVHPASVTTADCQRWLDGLKGQSSTKNATRRVLHRLFSHCESRGYIPRNSNPIDGTQTYNGHKESAVEVWTPAEMTKLLSHADQDFVPALAIGGFAGLRTSEILALDWSDIRLPEHTIKVTHRKARCAGTRLAPITDNLAAWLTPFAKKSGPVWPHGQTWRERAKSFNDAQKATAAASGLEWKHNALRHSFISFRVALTQDVPRTALEAGNSPKTVFSHYRALATEAEGKAWFAIAPQTAANLVPLTASA